MRVKIDRRGANHPTTIPSQATSNSYLIAYLINRCRHPQSSYALATAVPISTKATGTASFTKSSLRRIFHASAKTSQTLSTPDEIDGYLLCDQSQRRRHRVIQAMSY
eukprot:scaffold996_cov107-Skeletonema_marinoi.AAC.2